MVRVKAAADMNEALSKDLFDKDLSGVSSRLLLLRNWKIYTQQFPILDVGFRAEKRPELRIRIIATNWNDEPASVELCDGDGSFLSKVPQIPGSSLFNNGPHPATGRPFICMIGTREYHTHPSHINDDWENFKTKSTLAGLLTQLWNAWLKATP